MVSKNKIWVDGDVLPASELNNNILQPLSNLDATDDADVSVDGSFSVKKTLDIDANQINNFIIVKYGMTARGTAQTSGGDCTVTSRINIDSVQKFERNVTGRGSGVPPSSNGSETDNTRYITFKYVPTVSEKTNGFTVDITANRSTNNGNDGWIHSFEVWGA